MKKIIKTWGGSLAILFDSEDVVLYDLKEGDVLDIEFSKVKENKK